MDPGEGRARQPSSSGCARWPETPAAIACHTHMSCTERCPKHLSPTASIAGLKREVLKPHSGRALDYPMRNAALDRAARERGGAGGLRRRAPGDDHLRGAGAGSPRPRSSAARAESYALARLLHACSSLAVSVHAPIGLRAIFGEWLRWRGALARCRAGAARGVARVDGHARGARGVHVSKVFVLGRDGPPALGHRAGALPAAALLGAVNRARAGRVPRLDAAARGAGCRVGHRGRAGGASRAGVCVCWRCEFLPWHERQKTLARPRRAAVTFAVGLALALAL